MSPNGMFEVTYRHKSGVIARRTVSGASLTEAERAIIRTGMIVLGHRSVSA